MPLDFLFTAGYSRHHVAMGRITRQSQSGLRVPETCRQSAKAVKYVKQISAKCLEKGYEFIGAKI